MRIVWPLTARLSLVCLSHCLALGSLGAQEEKLTFHRLSLDQGLSQNSIHAIAQDRHGFLWFGTEDGLNRYDGQGFTVFQHDPLAHTSLSHSWIWALHVDGRGVLWVGTNGGGLNRWDPHSQTFRRFRNVPSDPLSLSHDSVRVIYESQDGALWIGTDGGLNRFDSATETFARFTHDPVDPSSLSGERILAVEEDRHGDLWVGTWEGGLNRFDRATGSFVHYRHRLDDPSSLSDDHVRAICEDRDGALWVGTFDGGLNRFDRAHDDFTRYQSDPSDPTSLSSNRVRSILQDTTGVLWIGTDGGLHRWQGGTSFRRYVHAPADPRSLSDDRVRSLYQDRGGVLWVGTNGGGLSRRNLLTGTFSHFQTDPAAVSGLGSLSHNAVTSFYHEKDGRLWIGTFGGGLNELDRSTHRFTHYRHDPKNPRSLSDDRVMSLLVDGQGALWVGTYAGGLNRRDANRGDFVRYRHDPLDPRSLSQDAVMALYEDHEGVVWVGTFEGGLNRYDRESGTFFHYSDAPGPEGLGSDRVAAFHEDASGVLWIGTVSDGLARFDRDTETFAHYRNDPTDPTSLSGNSITTIAEDADGTLWIGTRGTGLNGWDPADRASGRAVFQRYSQRDGLPNASIYGILPDEWGNLWLSTNRGLSRFDLRSRVAKNYNVTHGLQSDEFNFGAYHRGVSGEMFFGGVNGFNAFYPERLYDNAHVPPVVLTALYKFDQKLEIGLPTWEAEEIELDYKDYAVSFEFAALDYTIPAENRYAYKLEGFDQNWVEVGTLHRATYTNLDPGRYVFHVKGSNNDGVWNHDGASLELRVLPPPWKTWWAYGLYLVSLVGVVGAYLRHQRYKFKREAKYSRKLEVQVRTRTKALKKKNEELERATLTDSLTGLWNRRYLNTHVHQEIEQMELQYDPGNRDGCLSPPSFLFMMIDLDGFKKLNDTYGHAAGDLALLQVRDILQDACRESDTLIRWAGDEFLVVGRGADRTTAERIAERIRSAVDQHPFELGSEPTEKVSCSIGFALYPFLPSHPTLIDDDKMVMIADRALYVAKARGRNAWAGIYSTETTPRANLLRRINTRLELLVEQGALEVRCSPEAPEGPVRSERQRGDQRETIAALIDLPDRETFRAMITDALQRNGRSDPSVAMMLVAIDRPRETNHRLSSEATQEELLQELAGRLVQSLRRNDYVGLPHFQAGLLGRSQASDPQCPSPGAESPSAETSPGGDELVVLLRDFKRVEDVARVASRLLKALQRPLRCTNEASSVDASIGIAISPRDGSGVNHLVDNARAAVSRARSEGGSNSFQFFDKATNVATVKRFEIEHRLCKAMEREELVAFYQPLVDVPSRQIVGIEALLRWSDRGTLMPPDQFIPLAEDIGLIRPMGRWILNTACRELSALHQEGFPFLRLSVNLAGQQLSEPGFVDSVARTLKATGVDPTRVELELTESTFVESNGATRDVLCALRKLGVQLAADDFGTGKSALSYLREFPLTTIKIDRSYISGIAHPGIDRTITLALIDLAHGLGLRVVAEGVETEKQFSILRQYGCDEVQGFLISKPVGSDELRRTLTEEPVRDSPRVARA